MQYVQVYRLFHLHDSDLQSNWYLLSGSEIRASFSCNPWVLNSDFMKIGPITNANEGDERLPQNAKCTY
jgi:hypothetical protein